MVMPLLARAKRRVARRINSRALQADSRQTDICAYLSAILIGGLVLNAMLSWGGLIPWLPWQWCPLLLRKVLRHCAARRALRVAIHGPLRAIRS